MENFKLKNAVRCLVFTSVVIFGAAGPAHAAGAGDQVGERGDMSGQGGPVSKQRSQGGSQGPQAGSQSGSQGGTGSSGSS
ncbi:MAG TPA: hypothetical protein VL380_03880, partial [Nitrosospira sp.]|nr:hypothetical protein [Nitrosospira sp.]